MVLRVAGPPSFFKAAHHPRRSEVVALIAMTAALAIAPTFVYPLLLMKALCFAVFACAFNLLIGQVGLLSFGHTLFFGWAGYVCAHAASVWGLSPELAILVGSAAGAGLGCSRPRSPSAGKASTSR